MWGVRLMNKLILVGLIAFLVLLVGCENVTYYQLNLECSNTSVTGYTEIKAEEGNIVALGEQICNEDGLCIQGKIPLGKKCKISAIPDTYE